jgi:hypothetical protein
MRILPILYEKNKIRKNIFYYFTLKSSLLFFLTYPWIKAVRQDGALRRVNVGQKEFLLFYFISFLFIYSYILGQMSCNVLAVTDGLGR